MIENSVSFNQSTQNSKTVLSLGAGSTSQSGKQSPAVKESKETFQTALKTATDKSMDAKALPPKTQPSDGKASDLEAAASNPAAEHVTAETETETEVAPVVAAAPAVPDLDDEQTDMTAVSDALVQLLLIALNPDSTDEDVQKSIQTVLEGLSAEQKPLLLEMFESVLAKVEQLKPSDIKQTAALEELLKMLVPEDEARQLLPLITDPKKNIMQPGEGAITVDLASKSAVKPVVQLINQIISLLDENQNSVDIAKNDIAIKTDNGAKPELPDMFMAFKARLAAIVNELKTAINGPQSEVDPDFALNLQQTVAPVKSANETDGKESLKSNVDSGSKQNAKTPDAAQTAGVHMPVAQFKAHAAAARQAAPQVNVQNILEQIVQNANLRTGPAGNQMEIQLKPEFLGKLSIVLTSTDEGVVATIKAATAEVRNALSANIAQLQTALRESGINMKDISISNSTLTSDFARSESGARQNPESENEAFNRVTRLGRMLARATSVDRPAESALMYDSSQNLPVISSDMVSVEFSA